jgi:hypothetical protein
MTFPKSNIGALDRSPIVKPKPCCQRLVVVVDSQPVSTWCVLADGHQGGHEAPAGRRVESNEFGPEDAVNTRRGKL